MDAAQISVIVGGYATVGQPGIYGFTLDRETGTLHENGAYAGIENPSYVAAHPNGRRLYAVSEIEAGAVWALHVALEPWRVTPINAQPSGGAAPCHLALDTAGRWLIVANYGSGTVAVLPIRSDGALGAMTDHHQHEGQGAHPTRQATAHAHAATFSPDERFVIVADLGMDALMVYAFDHQRGKLHQHARVHTRPGAGPRHLVFDRDGRYLYVAHELDNTVVAYDYDATDGALHETCRVSTLPPDAPESYAAGIQLAREGTRLRVSNRGHDSVAMFSVQPNGQLVRQTIGSCGGTWPRAFAITPDERWLLVANQYSNDLSVLPLRSDQTIGPPAFRAEVRAPAIVQIVEREC